MELKRRAMGTNTKFNPQSALPPPQSRWAGADWVPLALLLALAVVLRVLGLARREAWLDENYSVVMALWPAGVLRGALGDTNPPLYLYLLKGWMALFGTGEAAIRSLSLVFGVAQLAALGAWLRRFGLPRRAALWAVALGALSPLHIYYSQEARAYTLLLLLATLALWSLAGALARGRRRDWLAHGVCLVLALYTNNIFIFFLPAFWAAAAVLRPGRRGWMRMAVTYGLAGLLYLPWLVVTLRVVRGGSLAWIAETWSAAGAWKLIPASLEILGLGARAPGWAEVSLSAMRLCAMGWLGLAGACVIAECGFMKCGMRNAECGMKDERGARSVERGEINPSQIANLNSQIPSPQSAIRNPQSMVLFLALFTLVPLAVMLLFSLAVQPIYVVGRYDTLVLPALLGLLGIGAGRLHEALARRGGNRLAAILVALVPLAVCTGAVAAKFRPEPAGAHVQRQRGEVLRACAGPDDVVVCLGLEGAKIAYQLLRQGMTHELLTYPLETQSHLGYFLHREAVKHPERLRSDAAALLDRFAAGKGAGRRLWLMLDPMAFRPGAPGSEAADCTIVARALLGEIERRGLPRWGDEAFLTRVNLLGIRVYALPADTTTSTKIGHRNQ